MIRELDAGPGVRHTRGVRLALLLLLVSSAVRAWEPSDAASVDARIAELRTAWEGKDRAAIGNGKLQRARQPVKPGWVSRMAFRIDDGLRRLYLGVGAARLPPAAIRPTVLDDAPATPEGAVALDWYLDETTGTLYALTVQER